MLRHSTLEHSRYHSWLPKKGPAIIVVQMPLEFAYNSIIIPADVPFKREGGRESGNEGQPLTSHPPFNLQHVYVHAGDRRA